METPTFPKRIFVTQETDGDNSYLNVFEKASRPEDALIGTEMTRVATYELVDVREGRLEPVISTVVG